MKFANIECLLLLFLLIPYIVWYIKEHHKTLPALQVSSTWAYQKNARTWKTSLVHVPFILRIVAFIMLVIILARPQSSNNWQKSDIEGIDIMLVMDVSTSMLAEDLSPNRIEAAKLVATEFINARKNDNIGLTVFAGESFTQCPLTSDHGVLLQLLHNVSGDLASRGMINDGTAIGMGLANAINRLKESKAKSKVIILLTDGTNNMGDISPLTAADIAKEFGVRIYTIGVGKDGKARYPVQTVSGVQYINVPVEIDEETLQSIADGSDGKYFRAGSTDQLKKVYTEIDQLEKTKLNVKRYSKREEEYMIYAFVAFFALLLDVLLRNTVLKRIP
jgi:Ca-activated chloride channel family protein